MLAAIHYCILKQWYLHFASDLLELSDLDLLTQELKGVKEKWKAIGIAFEFSVPFLNNIDSKYYGDIDCLRRVLYEQLNLLYPKTICTTTWRNIVDVLKTPAVMELQLADHLEAKYTPSELFSAQNLL